METLIKLPNIKFINSALELVLTLLPQDLSQIQLLLSYLEIFLDLKVADNFVFLDPPYDSEFNDYGFDDFNRQSQIELAEIFKTTKNI